MLKQNTPRLVVTFHTTAAAMETERLCKLHGIPGRLLPAPRSVTSDCGIAWCQAPEDRSRFETLAAEAGLELAEVYEMQL